MSQQYSPSPSPAPASPPPHHLYSPNGGQPQGQGQPYGGNARYNLLKLQHNQYGHPQQPSHHIVRPIPWSRQVE